VFRACSPNGFPRRSLGRAFAYFCLVAKVSARPGTRGIARASGNSPCGRAAPKGYVATENMEQEIPVWEPHKKSAVPQQERRFRPIWPDTHAQTVHAGIIRLQTRTVGPKTAMNCKHRPILISRGKIWLEKHFGPYRGLPVRQQKSACYGIPRQRDASINTAPNITSAIHNSRFGGIPILATTPIQKGKNGLYCDCMVRLCRCLWRTTLRRQGAGCSSTPLLLCTLNMPYNCIVPFSGNICNI
jgi:hypothetical protein